MNTLEKLERLACEFRNTIDDLRKEQGASPEPLPVPEPLLTNAQKGWLGQRRDGEWVLITRAGCEYNKVYPIEYVDVEGISHFVNERGEWSDYESECDITYCEPPASHGTPKWGLQRMRLGGVVYNPACERGGRNWLSRTGLVAMDEWLAGGDQLTCGYASQSTWLKSMERNHPSGWVEAYGIQWKLLSRSYPLHPENWRARTACGNIRNVASGDITRILDPEEVVVDFGRGIKGTIMPASGEQPDMKNLVVVRDSLGGYLATININRLLPNSPTDVLFETVRSLAAKIRSQRGVVSV